MGWLITPLMVLIFLPDLKGLGSPDLQAFVHCFPMLFSGLLHVSRTYSYANSYQYSHAASGVIFVSDIT